MGRRPKNKNVVETAEVKAEKVKTEEVKAEALENAEVVETAVEAVSEEKTEKAAKEVKKASKASKADKKEVEEEKTGTNVVVEFNGTQRSVEEIVDKIKAEWVEAGHRVSSIKSLDVYIKPQDYTAYYVINGKVQGKVWM